MAKHDEQRARVGVKDQFKDPLAESIEDSVAVTGVGLQEICTHHRSRRERHEQRDDDRDRQRHGEFAEQPTDDTAHQQNRNKDGNQRNADRQHGKADFFCPKQ